MNVFDTERLWSAVGRRVAQGLPRWLLLVPFIGGLAVALAAETGVRVFTTEWNAVFGYSARPDDGDRMTLLWVALAVAPFVQAAAGVLVLPLYGLKRRLPEMLAVAIVGTVPLYVAGLAMIVLPGILLVLVAFFVSCVWWTTGAYELLDLPRSEGVEFVTITILAASSALFLCSTLFPF